MKTIIGHAARIVLNGAAPCGGVVVNLNQTQPAASFRCTSVEIKRRRRMTKRQKILTSSPLVSAKSVSSQDTRRPTVIRIRICVRSMTWMLKPSVSIRCS